MPQTGSINVDDPDGVGCSCFPPPQQLLLAASAFGLGAQQLALLSASVSGLGAQQDAFFSTTFEVEPQQPEDLTTESERSAFT
jgi:hypothetical protein